jgi:hypothetical protein
MNPEEELRRKGSGSKVLNLSSYTKHRQEMHLRTRVSVMSNKEGLHPVRKQQ